MPTPSTTANDPKQPQETQDKAKNREPTYDDISKKFDMNEEYNDLYNQIKRKITKKKKPVQKKTNFKIPNWSIANEWANISDENQLNAALEKNPQVKSLLGHSLGGAAVLEKQIQNLGRFETTTYASPTLQISSMPQGNRYRSS